MQKKKKKKNLEKKKKKKVKIVCVHVIPYIHSHKELFPYISMATITTFPGTTLIPEWKLGWIGKKVSPSVVCLAQNIPDLANARQDLSLPDNLLYIYNCNEKYLIYLLTCNCCQKKYVGQKQNWP